MRELAALETNPPPRPDLRPSTLRVEWNEGFGDVAREWDALADDVGASPFRRPGWMQAWWDAFGGGRPLVLAVRRDGRLVGLAPLARRGSVLAAPANWHTMDYGLLATDPEVRDELVLALYGDSARRIGLGFLEDGSADLLACRLAAKRHGRRVLARTLEPYRTIPVDRDWDAYLGGLSKNRRGDLRRCRRRLEESGRVDLDVRTGVVELDEVLSEIVALEASGWKGARRTAMASRPETEAFYRTVARWAARRGWLRLYVLRLNGRAVAFHLALADRGVTHHLKSGFDEAHRRSAPGMLILADILAREFADAETRHVVLGAVEPYKMTWPGETRQWMLVQAFAPTAAGALDWFAFAHGRPAAKRLRHSAARLRRPDAGASG